MNQTPSGQVKVVPGRSSGKAARAAQIEERKCEKQRVKAAEKRIKEDMNVATKAFSLLRGQVDRMEKVAKACAALKAAFEEEVVTDFEEVLKRTKDSHQEAGNFLKKVADKGPANCLDLKLSFDMSMLKLLGLEVTGACKKMQEQKKEVLQKNKDAK